MSERDYMELARAICVKYSAPGNGNVFITVAELAAELKAIAAPELEQIKALIREFESIPGPRPPASVFIRDLEAILEQEHGTS